MPSAGARYPVRLAASFRSDNHIVHYAFDHVSGELHPLAPLTGKPARYTHCAIHVGIDPTASVQKYGERGKIYSLLECGHALETLHRCSLDVYREARINISEEDAQLRTDPYDSASISWLASLELDLEATEFSADAERADEFRDSRRGLQRRSASGFGSALLPEHAKTELQELLRPDHSAAIALTGATKRRVLFRSAPHSSCFRDMAAPDGEETLDFSLMRMMGGQKLVESAAAAVLYGLHRPLLREGAGVDSRPIDLISIGADAQRILLWAAESRIGCSPIGALNAAYCGELLGWSMPDDIAVYAVVLGPSDSALPKLDRY